MNVPETNLSQSKPPHFDHWLLTKANITNSILYQSGILQILWPSAPSFFIHLFILIEEHNETLNCTDYTEIYQEHICNFCFTWFVPSCSSVLMIGLARMKCEWMTVCQSFVFPYVLQWIYQCCQSQSLFLCSLGRIICVFCIQTNFITYLNFWTISYEEY